MDFFVLLQRVIPQKLITYAAGLLAAVRNKAVKGFLITQFVKLYKVDMTESVLSVDQFDDFNDFFTRELRPGKRPITGSEFAIVSPADGAISELGDISRGRILQAKGVTYSLENLVASKDMAEKLEGGVFATIYLSPRDYHRVHMPLTGDPVSLTYVPGKLFSVNQRTAENLQDLFSRNERLVARFKHQNTGLDFCLVMVGAMIVGGMETVLSGKIERCKQKQELEFSSRLMNKGEEFGRFYLGSTAIVLCPAELKVSLAEDLQAGVKIRMGQELGDLQLPN